MTCGNPLSFADSILYGMCEMQPAHTDRNIIASKVFLIGRSYAAAIERGAKPTEKSEHFYRDTVAGMILESNMDEWIEGVRHIKVLTTENIIESLRCHKLVMDLFSRIANGTTKRALASKYLHFHAPNAFFIYDSRAKSRIGQLVRGKNDSVCPDDCDSEYKIFCEKCLIYLKGKSMTPRDLDNELLGLKS